ncbi:MAG: GC-type dockerin domain-anchored protein [Phycisphaerales bacterium JB039]
MLWKSATIAITLTPLWVSAQCEPVWSGLNGGAGWEVRDFGTFDEDGAGGAPPRLFPGGGFDTIAGVYSPRVVRWDGWAASPVGEGLGGLDYGVHHVRAHAPSTGKVPVGLYVGGRMIESAGGIPVNSLARWDGARWHDVGGGVTQPGIINSYVFATQLFDEDGAGPLPPALFVGGKFQAAGGVPVDGLARWDGERWSKVGAGLAASTGPGRVTVFAMTVFDDGRGPALYVAGSFNSAGGEEAWNIARWDGAEWTAVGPGLGNTVESLCVFDEDGPGPKRPALFAGGQFNSVSGGEPYTLRTIGRWDGAAWTDVGGWLSGGVIRAMAVWDEDGAGPKGERLYVGGACNILPDLTPINNIASWDGERWRDVGGGVTGFGAGTSLRGMTVFDEDGPGPNPGGLYVGGLFYYAGGVYSKHIARWGCPLPPAPPCPADCDGDGELTFFDFLCFQNQFAFGDMRADCDGDGSLTFFDFLCFQNQFSAGCP